MPRREIPTPPEATSWPALELPITPPIEPMEAELVRALPASDDGDGDRDGDGDEAWQYEPKWDGFRCLAFRDHDVVALQSKAGQPLARYFPEMVDALRALPVKGKRFVLDGELVVPVEGAENFSFDALLQRIHPAASRVRRLAKETPSAFIAFDLLVDPRGRSRMGEPLRARRAALEALATAFDGDARFRLSPATTDRKQAEKWLRGLRGRGVDGVMAKRLDAAYAAGSREAMQKVKVARTADCVVGGFRYGTNSRLVGSLLLGLFDREGRLHHVGFCSTIPARDRAALTKTLESLAGGPGFTGRAPGGPSRWSRGRDTSYLSLRHELVVEVSYDHVSGGRFRHGTRLVRFRPEKAPEQCTLAQIAPPKGRVAA